MKIKRDKPSPTSRQRLRSNDLQSPPARKNFAYSSRRSDEALNTGRQLQRDIKESAAKGFKYSLQRFGLVVLLFAAGLSLFNILKVTPSAKIEPLTTGATSQLIRPMSDYEAYANQALSASIWNRNKVTINTGELSDNILAKFPELSSASVTVPLLAHRPVVYVQPSAPRLILLASNGAFVVSDTGRALLRGADAASFNQPDLPVITDQSGLQIELGRQALPTSSVSFIGTVIGQLDAARTPVDGMFLPSNANELDVQIAGQPYQVKFNLHSDKAREQVGTYLATIASLQKQNITPSMYIDVRVAGRAYYK